MLQYTRTKERHILCQVLVRCVVLSFHENFHSRSLRIVHTSPREASVHLELYLVHHSYFKASVLFGLQYFMICQVVETTKAHMLQHGRVIETNKAHTLRHGRVVETTKVHV